jgi:hypothetical protein
MAEEEDPLDAGLGGRFRQHPGPLYVGGLQPGLVAGALFAGQMDHGLHADQRSLYAAAV